MTLPRVSIVVLGYLESNRDFLEACLASVDNLDYPKELLDVTVVSDWYDGPLQRISTPRPGGFSHSVNAGIRASYPKSDVILVLSDDTIIARDALKSLALAAASAAVIVGPLSNCDNFWKYVIPLPHAWPERYYKRGQLKYAHNMQNDQSPITQGLLFTDTLCFYAFALSRSAWNAIGELDERYNMGYEDSDYCERAKRLGIRCVVALNALIYHAGGASESIITPEMRAGNEKAFNEKWLGPYE